MGNMFQGPVPLSNATLGRLPKGVARPIYDRAALTPGIVHIGLGNFHRAHQAWYLHRLMQAGHAMDWAIIGAGVRPYDAAMREKLIAQDCLTTLIELAPGHRSAEVIGPMIDYLPIEEGNGPLIRAMADPAIRIVALTVTEGGYYTDPTTGGLDTAHPDIAHDAAHPDKPKTAFGAMVAALARRKAEGLGPFTGLCCDNLRGNGTILRQAVVGLARLSDPALADWIDTEGAFPNSMVDCIVPATGPAELALARGFGIADPAPVSHEAFRQWVLEDDFCAGRPDWDEVGAIFTDDVHSYEMMKIRVLNAGHQVLANAGELLSLATISDCMADPTIAAFFRRVQTEEILPHVHAVPGMTPEAYLELIEGRFANPEIRDTTRRVAFDGHSRHPGFVLPIVRSAQASGTSLSGLALVEALWARMCEGTREDGTKIEPNDPEWEALTKVARAARERPAAWLEQAAIYGDLARDPAFRSAFEGWLSRIWRDGTAPTLAAYTAGA
ncbi:mannitol dehydrogenase family protein [Roseibacterium sp. SDUM158016]|uniref:mannitol dehydrogenase family protein n=1 Tax=Roseicyclus sediminis TaxID=2980997 RepID=UPI0021CE7043|nr:mannitol dehydrogenase family protein [Roseibacterium sp. SDUM158016]MCU4652737.1 mannitol dehydrogenase family protein [Roseibacterium sp. SDUM158016]